MADYQLVLIDLDQEKTGYRRFVSCWVLRKSDLTVVVDPGPKATIPFLVSALTRLGVDQIDYILLTHIHLDHGGGTADLLQSFPHARVFCHEIGVKHIISPDKLWRGSMQVLGEVALMYGKPAPVPAHSIVSARVLEDRGIDVIPTPGHAPHHVSFLCDRILFAGEAIGTRADLPGGAPYLRPATPPTFYLDVALESLDRLLDLSPEPSVTAFAHHGQTDQCFLWCTRAKEQLQTWVDTIRELSEESPEQLEQRLFDRLMDVDPLYGKGHFEALEKDLQIRERGFLANTLDGMLDYIKYREGR